MLLSSKYVNLKIQILLNQSLLWILFSILTLNIHAQFHGGYGDGYSMSGGDTTINNQYIYCSGGINDGYDLYYYSGNIYGLNIFCYGGNGDGADMTDSNTTVNYQFLYCNGGINDGYDLSNYNGNVYGQDIFCYGGYGDGVDMNISNTTVNNQLLYCSGGAGDGYDLYNYNGSVFGANIFCYGGIGDGYNFSTTNSTLLGYGIWTGLSDSDWNTSTNWKHNTVPGITRNVTIPAGCNIYPVLNSSLSVNSTAGAIECRGLDIQNGALFYSSGWLLVKGNMNVSGSYTCIYNTSNSQRINDGGELTITSTGIMKLGAQSSGIANNDLQVNNGGILNVLGGTLEIDDQLNINPGGEINMTGGTLFAHKYGRGTVYSSNGPGSFYIAAGALGSINGGTVKVCGRPSIGVYHAVNILEPAFSFSGTSYIELVHGDYAIHYNCSVYTVNGAILNGLKINKSGKTVFANSNLDIKSGLFVEPGSAFEIISGFQVNIGN